MAQLARRGGVPFWDAAPLDLAFTRRSDDDVGAADDYIRLLDKLRRFRPRRSKPSRRISYINGVLSR